tara:strand:- start:157 stop:669 length:513 start_codon:yes stop_codon:yes gene_type:complete
MAGNLLSFKNYIGGSDNVQIIELFPRSQKTFTYDFGANVSGYSFTADYQSIVLDSVTYDRTTGNPSLSSTNVKGYFTNYATVSSSLIGNASASTGTVTLTIPENRYTGNLIPNARADVVCTVLSFQWVTDDTPAQKDSHRWAIFERFEPESGKKPISNISAEPGFVSLTS